MSGKSRQATLQEDRMADPVWCSDLSAAHVAGFGSGLQAVEPMQSGEPMSQQHQPRLSLLSEALWARAAGWLVC